MSSNRANGKTYARRRKAALKAFREIEDAPAALLVTDETNVRYLTGFTGDSTALLLAKGVTCLISDGRYETQIEEECPGLDAVIRPPAVPMPQAIARTLKRVGLGSVGIESEAMTVAAFGRLTAEAREAARANVAAVESPVPAIRMVKDADEVAEIREAIRIAEAGFDYFRHRMRPELSERALAADLEHVLRQFGATGFSFPGIIAAGDRAALPHYEPGDVMIGEASHVLIDWGVRLPSGYVSDMTRVLMRAKTPKRIERVYESVLRAFDAGVAAIRPGVTAEEVDAAARDSLKRDGLAKHFRHSLGHGIGLNVHEGPGLRPSSGTELAAGMVVTVEPGVYLAGVGGVRIEDDVLVTETGAEILGSLPRDLDSMRLAW